MKYAMALCMMLMLLFAQSPEKEAAAFDGIFAQFKSNLGGKDYTGAYEKLHSALEIFWQRTPLLLRNVRFVKGEDNSFGIYEPKEGNSFASGELLCLYLEPIGYAFVKNPAGYYEFGFSADFTLEDADGNVLGGQKGFAKLDFNSWNHNTEVSLTFTYNFTGIEKGKYKVVTHVMDAHSEKDATVDNWFFIN
jgi:hypothetical protein